MPTSEASQPAARPVPERRVAHDAVGEHIYLADDTATVTAEPQTVTGTCEVRDRLRRTSTKITFYAEGLLRVERTRRERLRYSHLLDLRYLDPVPTVRAHYAKQWLKIATGCTAVATLTGLLANFALLRPFVLPASIAAGVAALATLAVFVSLSHEKIVFRTLHGRAAAIKLKAGLGYIRRLRAALPIIIRAIQDAEEDLGEDTAVFLRAEMREHYRLRGAGVLSERECGDGTGRILTHFDDDM